MWKQIIISIVLIFVIVLLSGCNEVSNSLSGIDSRLIGTWQHKEQYYTQSYTFFSDGSCSIPVFFVLQGVSGIWEIKNNQLIIEYWFEGTEYTTVYDYSFSDNFQTLTLMDVSYSGKLTLTKQ